MSARVLGTKNPQQSVFPRQHVLFARTVFSMILPIFHSLLFKDHLIPRSRRLGLGYAPPDRANNPSAHCLRSVTIEIFLGYFLSWARYFELHALIKFSQSYACLFKHALVIDLPSILCQKTTHITHSFVKVSNAHTCRMGL